jgi:hypothetical protein
MGVKQAIDKLYWVWYSTPSEANSNKERVIDMKITDTVVKADNEEYILVPGDGDMKAWVLVRGMIGNWLITQDQYVGKFRYIYCRLCNVDGTDGNYLIMTKYGVNMVPASLLHCNETAQLAHKIDATTGWHHKDDNWYNIFKQSI